MKVGTPNNRQRLKNKIRTKVSWTATRPRLTVFKSLKNLSVQLIDDETWTTIASSSRPRSMKWASELWADIAAKAKELKITQIVFDRNWYKYHWIIKKLADSAREAWLEF